FFFFQAEDGIRDGHVTGVQTCALPISKCFMRVIPRRGRPGPPTHSPHAVTDEPSSPWYHARPVETELCKSIDTPLSACYTGGTQIGRASCRERVEVSVVAVALEIKDYG